MLQIPQDLPREAVPFSWLLGVWEGTGVAGGDAAGAELEFGVRASFLNDGFPFVQYNAFYWVGTEGAPLTAEMGYWRLARPPRPQDPGPALIPPPEHGDSLTAEQVSALRGEDGFPIEVSMVHPDGVSELFVGRIDGPRIEIATDAVMRSVNARSYTAAERMWGLVDGKLLWAWDIAALGHPLGSHASATMQRVGAPSAVGS